LVTYRYEVVISNLQLAGISDSFLKRNELLPPYVPLVITAAPSDHGLASRALNEGAFDLIMTPLKADEVVRTIRLALWHGKLLRLIQRNEASIDKYREHVSAYPDKTSLTPEFSKTLNDLSDFSALASRVEEHTRTKALARLLARRTDAEP
jgi:DNA-binding NtrC family response regulator